ncbi:nucleotidyltransferase family protein [Amycolatopsis albispora]|uniref:Molybdopterin-guanine dinucleotide biosynthesis protein MobA n=1 Tax=Amycolatopsis albispora TaxID=1804986 RepID=A0A344L8N5_9PSEU|nr:nucleotidyltransferase family protein [Amycolatopsis albispora]AXB44409.1 molybdopterin-guanine dinucleotide biosynthesis protein MobA [Amycolatopsis albispora]
MGECAGLLLAAGSGRRFGGPKALAEVDGEPLVLRALRTLADCSPVVVVTGAAASSVEALLPSEVRAVHAADWASGMGASLRAGLLALSTVDASASAVVVHLVDLPWVGGPVVRRLAGLAAPDVVARAAYGGVPGHPVLLGREHWAEIADAVSGDAGARHWLAGREDLRLVECGDLGSGRDVDRPGDLPRPGFSV